MVYRQVWTSGELWRIDRCGSQENCAVQAGVEVR